MTQLEPDAQTPSAEGHGARGDRESRDAGGAARNGGTHATAVPALDLERVRATGVNPLPVRALQIETSSICNFRCNSCALSLADYDRPAKHMQPEVFEAILDTWPTVEKIELQGVGEVFLNPRVLELIRIGSSWECGD